MVPDCRSSSNLVMSESNFSLGIDINEYILGTYYSSLAILDDKAQPQNEYEYDFPRDGSRRTALMAVESTAFLVWGRPYSTAVLPEMQPISCCEKL